MKIYTKEGVEIIDVAVNESCVWRKELMSEEYVLLKFSTAEVLPIKRGCYIRTDFGNGRYEVVSVEKPKYNTTTGAYDYEQKLHAEWEKWKRHILFYDRQNGNYEKSWSLTQKPNYFLSIIISNLSSAGLGTYTFVIEEQISEIKNIGFDGVSIFDALNTIAETWELEWWVEGHVIHLGQCEFGTAIDFEIGGAVSDMQQMESSGDYATRIYVFGSTRNLPTNYRGAVNNAVVEGVVEKRLALPAGTDHIDAWENLADEDVVEAVIINDDIYPRRIGTISDVTTKQYTDTITNDDGSTTKEQWNAYRYKDSGLTFYKRYVLPGQELRIVFQSGVLAGLDFAVMFNPLAELESSTDAQMFEIVRNEDYGIALPNDTLKPDVGDTYILYGYDTSFVADTMVGLAEQELLDFGLKKIVELARNESVFSCPTNPVRCAGYTDENGHLVHHVADEIDLDVGQSVMLINEVYFGTSGRLSRIRGFEKNLDDIFNARYDVGDSPKYSHIDSLAAEVQNISYKSATLFGGSNGSSVALIKRHDDTTPTDYNAYSAARARQEFLSKQRADTAEEKISFAKGLQSPGFIADASGMGIYKDANNNWVIEGDYFHVRKKLTAESVEIMNSSHIGGKLVATPGSMVVSSITIPDGVPYYRCYFRTEDSDGNEVYNTFAVNDLAYCETFNLTQSPTGKAGNHFFWRKVIAVGRDYIDLSATDCSADSDAPLVGDKITTLGNTSDATRQNAIIIAGAGAGNPYIRIFSGINSYTLPEPDAQLSPSGSWIKVTDKNGQKARIDELVSSLENSLEQVREQEDKQIVIWFGEAIPTLLNEPASDWSTTDMKEEHLKDIYYNNGYASTGGGRAYSFEKSTDNDVITYSWVEITDRDVLTALEAANRAQDTADGKRRVFVHRPTAEQVYDDGDLWVNAIFPLQEDGVYGDANGVQHTFENPLYDNDILRCVTAKSSGESFSIDHWQPVQKYQTSKIEQLATSITLEVVNGLKKIGIYINGEDDKILLSAATTEISDDLIVRKLETKPDTLTDENNKARVVIAGSTLDVFGSSGKRNIQFGVDSNGYAVLKYFNNNGLMLYDLGPNGMNWVNVSEEEFSSDYFVFISRDITADGDRSESTAGQIQLHRFKAKSINGVIYGGSYTNNDPNIASVANGRYFTSENIVASGELDSTQFANGLYRPTTSQITTFDDMAKFGDIEEAKAELKNRLGLTDAEIDTLDWTIDEMSPILSLLYPIYWQDYAVFTNGIIDYVTQYWQTTQEEH